ncbi:MAG: transposase [Flavobacteriaceae bacterium]|nr:transposase [Flavobacteriaceae bacterium]
MQYESLQKNNYYHIFNRGNDGINIFFEEENYNYFLGLLKKYIVPIADILSYCLLKNHFHLLVRIKDIENEKMISKSFSNLFNSYSKSINKRYNRTGSLFEKRFKRIKITDEDYLLQLIVYINLNPVYHQFVDKASDYKYSSYNAIISDKPTLLDRNSVINLFDDRDNFKYYINHKKNVFDEKMFLDK